MYSNVPSVIGPEAPTTVVYLHLRVLIKSYTLLQ
jgi:hypothetical protein